MFILDTTTKKLQIVLAAPKTTLDAVWDVTYEDTPIVSSTVGGPGVSRGEANGTTNGTTAVDMVGAPPVGYVRTINGIRINNADTGAITLSLIVNDNGTQRPVFKVSRATLDQLTYERGCGFQGYAGSGAEQ